MNELTVIIPFLNEGEEVYNTVQNLRETAEDKINIILINDASTDHYDYENAVRPFDVTYILHDKRIGVAASRDEAIANCPTEFFLLLDAHMRFYQNDWVELIITELKKDARSLLCCQSLSLEKDKNKNLILTSNKAETYGAYIDFSKDKTLEIGWSTYDPDPTSEIVEIPCILGAAYACNKNYWLYLKGLEGLRSYGYDEQLISLKVWLEGGTCKLLKKVKAGHLYRKTFPYQLENIDVIYNKLFIAELILPYKEKYNVFKNLEVTHKSIIKDAIQELVKNKKLVQEQHSHNNAIFSNPIEKIIKFNNHIQEKNILIINNLINK